uniref:EamA domain-containing protein n=2 Tax=Eutreptiella gymnastica TaxID=73025 RepID=A0A7S1I053_9EUGL|mmetsp:Transcript_11826/g.21455  ORF Transcript_11826/g.21455 Transcript_11826/m.21455 type:complete len:408 (+) Transcript_11826:18-1241(+)
MAGSRLYFLAVTLGLLLCGTCNSSLAKLIYSLEAPGADRPLHGFRKPWFQVTNMFIGMLLCLPLFRLKMWFRQGQLQDKSPAGLEEGRATAVGETDGLLDPTTEQSSPLKVFFPAMADLVSCGLMFSGLMFTTASVYQMLRGAQVVFCAVLSVIFLRRSLNKYEKAGILLTVVGITCVGCAPLLAAYDTDGSTSREASTGNEIFGIGLILLAELVGAFQFIMEEKLLQDVKMDAMVLAGYEGVWGSLVCLAVVLPLFQWLPGPDDGHLEDSVDSIYMLQHSNQLLAAQAVNVISVLGYNIFGLIVIQDFTAMHRVIMEASRSLLVWMTDLTIFYVITDGRFGEGWVWTSWIQLAGFIILLLGTCTYNWLTLSGQVPEDPDAIPSKDGRRHSVKSTGSHRSRANSGRW